MANQFNKAALKICVAQICQNIGWHGVHHSALDILVDLLQRYITEIGKSTRSYTNHYGRTESNLDDIGLAFRDIGVSVNELEDYVNNVESIPFVQRLPFYPLPHPNNLQFPKHAGAESRPEYIDDHYPSLKPSQEEEETLNSTNDSIKSEPESLVLKSVKVPEYLDANKRIRVAPEEEGQPAKETASVFMTPSGFVTPMREGKVPDPSLPSKLVKDLPTVSDDDYLSDGSLSDERTRSPIIPKPLSTTAIVKDIKKFKSVKKPSIFPSKKKAKTLIKGAAAAAVAKEKLPKVKKAPRKKKILPPISPEPELFSVNNPPFPSNINQMTPLQMMATKAVEQLDRPKSQNELKNNNTVIPPYDEDNDGSDNSTNLLIDEPGVSNDDHGKKSSSKLTSIDDVISQVIEEAREESKRQIAQAVENIEAKSSKRHSSGSKNVNSYKSPQRTVAPPISVVKSPPRERLYEDSYDDDPGNNSDGAESRPKTPDFGPATTAPLVSPPRRRSPSPSLSRSPPVHTSPPFSLTVKTLAERKAMSPVPIMTSPVEKANKHKEKKKSKEKEKEVMSKKALKEVSGSTKGSSKKGKEKKSKHVEDPVPRLTLKFGTSSKSKSSIKDELPEDEPEEEEEEDNDSDASFAPPSGTSSASRKRKRQSATPPPPPPPLVSETCGTTYDEHGNKIWICPGCAKPDDGSPMIGCDDCDDWYHWECVGIKVPPKEEVSWYCSRCLAKRKMSSPPSKKKKKKHRKDK